MRTMTQDEWNAEGVLRFGKKARNWKFICPACGTVQSIQQLIDVGRTPDDVHAVMGFSCIGRFTGQGDAGIAAHTKGQPWDKGCNWTLGGLLAIHTLEVSINGKGRPCFEFADADTQQKEAA